MQKKNTYCAALFPYKFASPTVLDIHILTMSEVFLTPNSQSYLSGETLSKLKGIKSFLEKQR